VWWIGLGWLLVLSVVQLGQNRVAAIAQEPGVSLLELQASQRHQWRRKLSQRVTGSGTKRLAGLVHAMVYLSWPSLAWR
jgi:hypothetical protein